MVIDSDALVQVEAAGQIDGNSHIIGGADINIITQDGVCGQGFRITACSGAQRYQFVIACGTTGFCQNSATLDSASSTQLAESTAR